MSTQLANQARATQAHLLEALKGVEEIIRLADEAGNAGVASRGRDIKERLTGAAEAFVQNVKTADGDADKVDPRVVRSAETAAGDALTELRMLHDQLARKIELTNKALGIEVDDDGNVRFIENGVARSAVENHKVLHGTEDQPGLIARVEALESALPNQRTDTGFTGFNPRRRHNRHESVDSHGAPTRHASFDSSGRSRPTTYVGSGTVQQYDFKKALGMILVFVLVFTIVGLLSLLFGWPIFGPVQGALIGAFIGALVAVFAALSPRSSVNA